MGLVAALTPVFMQDDAGTPASEVDFADETDPEGSFREGDPVPLRRIRDDFRLVLADGLVGDAGTGPAHEPYR